jgi:hypothetical protein
MFGGEALMALAEGKALGRLDKPPRPLGILLKIHIVLLLGTFRGASQAPRMTPSWAGSVHRTLIKTLGKAFI